ncbi:MAG: serine/threonine protein kinase, partial [Myxococcales bacterium]|nr:serine/threonine protein kinase [Myxococcales bacterium]
MSLKKFEILEMIAKGGMAEVYKAKTTGLQGFEKEVCVKKILPHLTEDDSFVNMFVNEAKLAATLNYANVVQVHDLCVSAGGEYFIVMEYVNGKDLSDVIRAAQLAGREVPADIAVYIAREVCKGLFYAHSKTDPSGANLNIIHRDISPHNVLVSFMGEVKITDFGIAKASSIMNKTAVGILKGKYGYMSPEQARGQPLDHRSDIFNTGIVLYELLVGERCFAGSSDFSTLNLMRNAEVTPPTKINRSVPPEVEAIVLKALSKERGDRYQDALALEGALADWAKKANSVATATELARFMRELFAQAEEREKAGSTGVLALSSVVGPAPKSEAEVARHQITPSPEPKAAAPKAEVGQEALERAKRRATKA